MGSGVNRVKTGVFYGSGANLDIRTVGYRPSVVMLVNQDSDDKLMWTDKMADATGHKTLKAGASSFLGANGITPLSDGFRLGADTDMNVSGELVHWIAFE